MYYKFRAYNSYQNLQAECTMRPDRWIVQCPLNRIHLVATTRACIPRERPHIVNNNAIER